MRCPHCKTDNDNVIETRKIGDGATIRRRRVCLNCGFRFTSYENIEEKPFMVKKRDGRCELFERSKLEKGVSRALEKRPFSAQQVESLVNDISDEAMKNGASEISTDALGKIVMQKLYEIDTVAYIRFASVYLRFDDLDEFSAMIRDIKKLRRKQQQAVQ